MFAQQTNKRSLLILVRVTKIKKYSCGTLRKEGATVIFAKGE